MTADEILAGMVAVYAECRTYCDRGRVTTRGRLESSPSETAGDRPFRTAFARPDRLRFEYTLGYPWRAEVYLSRLQAAGDMVRTWMGLGPVDQVTAAERARWEQHLAGGFGGAVREWRGEVGIVREYEAVGHGVAALTGVSGAASHTVPALLMPDRVSGRRLTDLAHCVRLDDADAGGVPCYRVRGHYPVPPGRDAAAREYIRKATGIDPGKWRAESQVLWIEQDSLLLRRVEGGRRTPGAEMTEYEPAVNVSILDDDLALEIPER